MSGSIIILLRQIGRGRWQLFAPRGHYVSAEFHGDKESALHWARNWISSFNNWTVKLEEDDYEEKD